MHSGLAPAVICDIATRALSFWVYQVGQEGIYQRLQLKKAQDVRSVSGCASLLTSRQKASNLEKQYNTLAQEVSSIHSFPYSLYTTSGC